jgi:hypothetical protein
LLIARTLALHTSQIDSTGVSTFDDGEGEDDSDETGDVVVAFAFDFAEADRDSDSDASFDATVVDADAVLAIPFAEATTEDLEDADAGGVCAFSVGVSRPLLVDAATLTSTSSSSADKLVVTSIISPSVSGAVLTTVSSSPEDALDLSSIILLLCVCEFVQHLC